MYLKTEPITPANYQAPIAQTSRSPHSIISRYFNKKLWISLLLTLLAIVVVSLIIVRPIELNIIDKYNPHHNVNNSNINFDSWLYFRWDQRFLVTPGRQSIQIDAKGYKSITTNINVISSYSNQATIELEPLPANMTVTINNTDIPWELRNESLLIVEPQLPENHDSTTSASDQSYHYQLEAETNNFIVDNIHSGTYTFSIQSPYYLDYQSTVYVAGKGQEQSLNVELIPNWGWLHLDTSPKIVNINNRAVTTPNELVMPANAIDKNTKDISISQLGYKTKIIKPIIRNGEITYYPKITLLPADIDVKLSSNPSDSSVLINGQFKGQTPLTLTLNPATTYQLEVFKAGYQRLNQSFKASSTSHSVNLQPNLFTINFKTSPSNATLIIDNKHYGSANQQIALTALPHNITIIAEGYIPKALEITPIADAIIETHLLTPEQDFWRKTPDAVQISNNHQLFLYRPNHQIMLGSDTTEQGRRANEGQWSTNIDTAFYVSINEVTNQQFRRFQPSHSSRNFSTYSLNGERQPVVNISWQQAALYCNWLSVQDGLAPFYTSVKGAVNGYNHDAEGYRLLTTVEWSWLSRYNRQYNQIDNRSIYLWGDNIELPQQALFNIADKSTAPIKKFIQPNYNDGAIVSELVGTYPPHSNGLNNFAGNVAEWVNDWYQSDWHLVNRTSNNNSERWGPAEGEFHSIRGASWARGYLPQLRWAYRDYGATGKVDVGFRITRSVKVPDFSAQK